MRDPFSWSIPLGRVFGILVRVHLLFPLVALGLIMRISFAKPSPPDHIWVDALQLTMLWFFSVFLHELGHCFGARKMNGDATEIMLWPLGDWRRLISPKIPVRISSPLCPALLSIFCFAFSAP